MSRAGNRIRRLEGRRPGRRWPGRPDAHLVAVKETPEGKRAVRRLTDLLRGLGWSKRLEVLRTPEGRAAVSDLRDRVFAAGVKIGTDGEQGGRR